MCKHDSAAAVTATGAATLYAENTEENTATAVVMTQPQTTTRPTSDDRDSNNDVNNDGNEEEPCSSARDNNDNYRTLSKSAQHALNKLAPFTKEGNNTEEEQAFILQRAFDGASSTATTTRWKRRCVNYY